MTNEGTGRLIPIGMRKKIPEPNALVISTCSDNDLPTFGLPKRWSWANPTNTRYYHEFCGITAVSTEALWQGCKLIGGATEPDPEVLAGAWRKNKGRKPRGAWYGPNMTITDPGEARRKIYIPAYVDQITSWLSWTIVRAHVNRALDHDGPVYLRDFDTGQGIDSKGPMSHAWLLSLILEPLLEGRSIDHIVNPTLSQRFVIPPHEPTLTPPEEGR